jgi:hypothetical protein
MAEWYEIAAGLPDASNAAGTWFDRMYGVRRQQTQDAQKQVAAQAAEKDRLTKILFHEDAMLKDALSGRRLAEKPIGAGKVTIDKSPWEAENRAYQQQAKTYKPPEPAFDALPEQGKPSGEADIQRQLQGVAPSASRQAAIEAKVKMAAQLHGPVFADFIRRSEESKMEPELAAERQALEENLRTQRYYEQFPGKTVPNLAAASRAATEESAQAKAQAAADLQAQKDVESMKRTKTTAGVGYQRNAMDQAERDAAMAAQEKQKQDYQTAHESLRKIKSEYDNWSDEGTIGEQKRANIARIENEINTLKTNNPSVFASPLPVKPETLLNAQMKSGEQKAKAAALPGGQKPFDTKAQAIKTLDKQIAEQRRAVQKAVQTRDDAAAERAETSLNSMVDEYRKLGGVGQIKQYTAVNVTAAELKTANDRRSAQGKAPLTKDDFKKAKIMYLESQGK